MDLLVITMWYWQKKSRKKIEHADKKIPSARDLVRYYDMTIAEIENETPSASDLV